MLAIQLNFPRISFLINKMGNIEKAKEDNTGLTEKFLRSYGRTQMNFKKEKYLFMFGALGFHCCQWAFSSCDVWGLLCCGAQASPAVTFLVGEHSLWSGKASVVVAHRLSCSVACEIFPDQGWNLCPLCWPKNSYPLCHQGNPQINFLANPIIIWRRCRLHWLFWASLVAQRLKKNLLAMQMT